MKKRLLAVLLAMLMVCSLLPAAALASEEETAAELVEEVVESVAEEETKDDAELVDEELTQPAEEAGELNIDPNEEADELNIEPSEENLGGELALEETPAALLADTEEEASLLGDPHIKEAKGFVDGQKYILAVAGSSPLQVLKLDGDQVVLTTVESVGAADSTMKWQSASGDKHGLFIGSYYLYTNEKMTISDSTKNKWSYSGEGILSYKAGGDTKYVSVSGSTVSVVTGKKDAATPLTLYTDGPETGSPDSGGSSSGGDDSAVIYKEAKALDKPYIAVVDTANGKALSFDRGKTESVSVKLDTKKKPAEIEAVKGVCLTVAPSGGGCLISIADPPDKPAALYVEGGELKKIETKGLGDTSPYAKWALDGSGHLCYDGTYYLDAAGNVSTTPYADVYVFGGDKDVGPGAPPGGETDKYAPVIDIESFTKAAAYKKDQVVGALNFSVTASPSEDAKKEGVKAADLTYQWYESSDGETYTFIDGAVANSLSVAPDTSAAPFAKFYQCKVSCVVKGEPHTTASSIGCYFVVSGEKEDTIMMFSDIHEEYDNLYGAFNTLLMSNGGYLPVLLMATGDITNDRDKTITKENTRKGFDAVLARNLGVKTIVISGNHDKDVAANELMAELAAADSDNEIKTGFNGENMLYESADTIVFGLNYENQKNGYGDKSGGLTEKFDKMLTGLTPEQQKKAIIIIAHAGLHNVDGAPSDYNLEGQDDFVDMLNKHAENLNISFFYGHNHSKGDPNQMFKSGDTIKATDKSDIKPVEKTLKFNYGTLGYLNNGISGGVNFGVVTLGKNGDNVEVTKAENLKATIPTTYKDPAPAPAPPSGGNGGSGVVKTGDSSTPVLWAVIVIAMAGALVALPKKKHN